MSKSVLLAVATAATFGALSVAMAPAAEAHKYRYEADAYRYDPLVDRVFYGTPRHVYNGYRPYNGPYFYRRVGIHQQPVGIFRPVGVSYRPYFMDRGPAHCLRWSFTYSRSGKPKKFRCMMW